MRAKKFLRDDISKKAEDGEGRELNWLSLNKSSSSSSAVCMGGPGWLMMVWIWPLSPVSAFKYVVIILNRADRRPPYLFLQGFRRQQMFLQLLSSLLEKLLQLRQLPTVLLFIEVDLLLQLEGGWLGRIHNIIHLQADNWYDTDHRQKDSCINPTVSLLWWWEINSLKRQLWCLNQQAWINEAL